MKVTITKKTRNIIILAIVFVILAGSGGYLLWRVNQADTVAPTDSDAGDNTDGKCVSNCNCNVYKSDLGTYSCNQTVYFQDVISSCGIYNDLKCSSTGCYRHNCGNDHWIMSKIANVNEACKDCSWNTDVKEASGACDFGSQCPACEWPAVGYCDNTDDNGTCTCNSTSANNCADTEPKCTPRCPTGYIKCIGSACGEDTVIQSCSARCDGCKNAYKVTIKCTKEVVKTLNVCDGGAWVTKPTGTYDYCEDLTFSATATDTDGIDEASIVVKLDDVSISKCATETEGCYNTVENGTTVTISGNINDSENSVCEAPGSHTISITWEDALGEGGEACTLTTAYTTDDIPTNPNWEISKTAVEQCIDEGTETPSSEIEYTVTVTNTGDGNGYIDTIVDTLDTKVSTDELSLISHDGIFSSGRITWDLDTTTGLFEPEEEKTYTYTVSVSEDEFGIYQNSVKATSTDGDPVIANANVTVDCEVGDTPETGLFDNNTKTITLGFIFILIGFGISTMDKVTAYQIEKGRKKLERKVVKN